MATGIRSSMAAIQFKYNEKSAARCINMLLNFNRTAKVEVCKCEYFDIYCYYVFRVKNIAKSIEQYLDDLFVNMDIFNHCQILQITVHLAQTP